MSDESGFQKRLEKIDDFHFIEHWEEGKRPFDWFAEWDSLFLKLSNIVIKDTASISERTIGEEEDAEYFEFFESTALDDDEWLDHIIASGGSKDELEEWKRKRAKLFNKHFSKPKRFSNIYIQADFNIHENRRIDFIADGGSPKLHGRYESGKISFRFADDVKPGALWVTDEDEVKYDVTGEESADTLRIHVSITEEEAKRFLDILRRNPTGSECFAGVSVLTFQSEMERSLAESWHSQTYCFEGKRAPNYVVMLNSLQVSERLTGYFLPSDDLEDLDDDSDGSANAAPGGAPSNEQATMSPRADVVQSVNMRPVLFVLWAIFFALILNVL